MGFATELAGGAGKLRGVVGVFASDGEDEFGGVAEFVEGGLSIFGGVANGIEINDFDFGPLLADFIHEGADAVDGLGGLRDDANAFDMRDGGDFIGVENDAGLWEVSLKAENFDVSFLADDDGLEALGDYFGELGVGDFDERAGGVGHLVTGLGPALAIAISGSVRRDDNMLGGRLGFLKRSGASTLGCEA